MEQWPSVTPIGHVKASDEECAKSSSGVCDSVDTVDEADIFRHHNGKLVLNGAMGVPKLKRLPDGSTVELQRFISNLVLMNAYFRRLRGDSSLLPPVSRLGLIVLDKGETLEIDSEDMESAFNLFRMPPV